MPSIRSISLTALALISLLTPFSIALPIPIFPQEPLATGEVTCTPLSQYTTEWFLAHTLPSYRHELHSTALFYTRGTSASARHLAHEHPREYTTIWDVWPCYLYDDTPVVSNPLRCIHDDHEQRQTFYENMSRAFARMARKQATVMHLRQDYETVPVDGIWGRVEMPTLREGTDVEALMKMNDDVSVSQMYALTRGAWETVKELVQRAMGEVQMIFREAKFRNDDEAVAACSLWGSVDEGWLDSLW